VCGGFEGVAEVRDSCIDQGEEVGHRAERRSPRSTYHRGSLSLNGLMGDAVIDPCRNLRHCDYDGVPRLLGAEVSGHGMRWFGVALTVVVVGGRERCLALSVRD